MQLEGEVCGYNKKMLAIVAYTLILVLVAFYAGFKYGKGKMVGASKANSTNSATKSSKTKKAKPAVDSQDNSDIQINIPAETSSTTASPDMTGAPSVNTPQ